MARAPDKAAALATHAIASILTTIVLMILCVDTTVTTHDLVLPLWQKPGPADLWM